MVQKQYVSWQDVTDFVIDVAKRYENVKVSGVYGVPRGGVIIATLLSYKMDIPILFAPAKDCIIMDDISDTGETLIQYAKNTSGGGIDKGYHIVTMFYKETCSVRPEFFKFIKDDKWVVYPWEFDN